MRQKAVSIAPQNEAPIQIAPSAATIPIVVELVADPLQGAVELVLLGRREQALQIVEHRCLDV